MLRSKFLGCGLTVFIAATLTCGVVPTEVVGKKPNILVIWGDDICWENISAYNLG